MKITGTAFPAYLITDIAHARAFYKGAVKLRPSNMFGKGEHFWIEPSIVAVSSLSTDKWRSSNDGVAIAFEGGDFEAAMNRLKKHNVNFVLEPFKPICWSAIILSLGDNSLAIHKHHARLILRFFQVYHVYNGQQ